MASVDAVSSRIFSLTFVNVGSWTVREILNNADKTRVIVACQNAIWVVSNSRQPYAQWILIQREEESRPRNYTRGIQSLFL